MAQTVTPSGGAGFPLHLTWVTWEGDTKQVTYDLTGDELRRSLSVNGGQPSQTLISQKIDAGPAMTNAQFSSGVLTFKVTATAGPTSETITSQVKARTQ